MSKTTIRRLNWFLAWNYDSEEELLNRYSEKGWRLVKVGYLHNVYEKDEKKYRYRIDYNKMPFNIDEKQRYIETFEEMGWHYIDCVYGWNYFEKEVKEEYTEEDYCIYTDNSSLMHNLRRWIIIARVIEIICIGIFFMNLVLLFEGARYNLFALITNLIEIILFEFGIRSMQQKRISVKRSYRSNVIIGNLLFFSMFVFMIICLSEIFVPFKQQAILNTHYQGTIVGEKPCDRLSFLVEDSGCYKVNADCTTKNGILVLSIYEGNNKIYTTQGTTLNVDDKLELKDGIHYAEISVDYGNDYQPDGNFYSVYLNIK